MIFRLLEKIVFVLCLVIQGLYVKWRIVKLPEPQGQRQGDSDTPNKKALSVLIVGDSAAAGVGAEHQNDALLGNLVTNLKNDYDLHWQLLASSGETTDSMISKLASFNSPYDYVVVSLGVNDITTPMRLSTWLKQQRQLLDLLFDQCQPNKIILATLPPIKEFFALPNPLRYLLSRRALRFTKALQEIAQSDSKLKVLDLPTLSGEDLAMASDGFHPGPAVYRAWANAIASVINQEHGLSSTKI